MLISKQLHQLVIYIIVIFNMISETTSQIKVTEYSNSKLEKVILKRIVANSRKEFNVVSVSRRNPHYLSFDLQNELHEMWYKNYNLTFLSFEESTFKPNLTCPTLSSTNAIEAAVEAVIYSRFFSDQDTERTLINDVLCYPDVHPIHSIWSRAVHFIMEPTDSDVDQSSVFKVGRKVVEFKPYDDVLVIVAESENFLNNVTFQSSLANFTFKIGILPQDKIYRYCLYCKEGSAFLIKQNITDELLIDTSKNRQGKYIDILSVIPDFVNSYNGVCNKSLELSYEILMICDIAKKFNFTWSLQTLFSKKGFEKAGSSNSISYPILISGELFGVPGAPYHRVFAHPPIILHATFVLRKPRMIISLYNYILPFKVATWIFVLSCLIFSSVFVAFAVYDKTSSVQKGRTDLFSNSLNFMLQHLVLQSSATSVIKKSTIFFGFWMFFSMVINTAYQSKLSSLLTVPTPEILPHRNFTELHNSHFKKGGSFISVEAFRSILSDDASKDREDPLESIVNSGYYQEFTSIANCLYHILDGEDIACIDADYYLWVIINRLFHEEDVDNFLLYSEETRETFFFGIGMWRENSFFPHVDAFVQRQLESGLVKKYFYDDVKLAYYFQELKTLKNNPHHKRLVFETSNLDKVKSLSFHQIRGLFLTFNIYIFISLLCHIMEICYFQILG